MPLDSKLVAIKLKTNLKSNDIGH